MRKDGRRVCLPVLLILQRFKFLKFIQPSPQLLLRQDAFSFPSITAFLFVFLILFFKIQYSTQFGFGIRLVCYSALSFWRRQMEMSAVKRTSFLFLSLFASQKPIWWSRKTVRDTFDDNGVIVFDFSDINKVSFHLKGKNEASSFQAYTTFWLWDNTWWQNLQMSWFPFSLQTPLWKQSFPWFWRGHRVPSSHLHKTGTVIRYFIHLHTKLCPRDYYFRSTRLLKS